MANHEIVYGICENKCQHEVYRKEVADDKFLSKADASTSYAIKNHATNTTAYGIGTDRIYGHVRLETALNMTESSSTGIALQASAGKVLNDKITALQNDKAPKIPVGGILPVSWSIGGDFIDTSIGYGTWELFHTLDLGSYDKNIYFYVRTS